MCSSIKGGVTMSEIKFAPIGSQRYTLDDKNRVRVPAEIFAKFSDEEVVIAPGVQGNLSLMTRTAFDRKFAALADADYFDIELQSRYTFLASCSKSVERDTQNRIVIPQDIKDAFGIAREVVFVAKFDFVEIWPAELFDSKPVITGAEAISKAMQNLGELLRAHASRQ